MNLKSHLYNKAHKTDRMFRDLNALQSGAPILDTNMKTESQK